MSLDVVYLFGPSGREDAEELRYSLRSLRNLPHRDVWIVGHAPAWVDRDRVRVLDVPTDGMAPETRKHEATTESLRTFCAQHDAPDSFALFNDDFFVMEEIPGVPMLRGGPMRDTVARVPRQLRSHWRDLYVRTLDVLQGMGHPDPVSYELHVPMVMNRHLLRPMLEAAQTSGLVCKRSLYGNLAHCGGHQIRDVKIRDLHGRYDGGPFVSTSEHSFAHGRVGRQIRAAFTVPSPYELVSVPVPTV